MNRLRFLRGTPAVLSLLIATLCGGIAMTTRAHHTIRYDEPVDAVSIMTPEKISATSISGLMNGEWTPWYELETEDEQDPRLMESNLVIFPQAVTAVRFRGWQPGSVDHPLRASQEPVSYRVAATRLIPTGSRPKILSRSEWGADESLLLSAKTERQATDADKNEDPSGATIRETECDAKRTAYPEDFRVSKTVKQNGAGKYYRWEKSYSPTVKMLVVHHTADAVTDDKRNPLDRMRLLYQFHAQSRGWGDIGYHYVIDEDGQIYEGRDGGKYVVGGHAYCANVGTVGIALMGNFEEEQPTQNQARSLQWLLSKLGNDYGIDLSAKISFRGEKLPTVTGHRDLVATSCPGSAVAGAMDQIRRNVSTGNVNATVRFSETLKKVVSKNSTKVPWYAKSKTSALSPVGSTDLTGRPGSQVRIALTFSAGDSRASKGERVAEVIRSDQRIGVWQTIDGKDVRVRKELVLPAALNKGAQMTLQLRLQLPSEEGVFNVKFDDIAYVLNSSGRGVGAKTVSYGPSPSHSSLIPSRTPSAAATDGGDSAIRIRLSYPDTTATVAVPRDSTINGVASRFFRVDLKIEGPDCVASEYGKELARGVVRISPAEGGIATIQTWQSTSNRFRGVMECRAVNGEFVLINELPLEQYLAGLAEEPDSEPYEKQRAFAVAARSYAAHYMDASHRKFPGMPYDGNDSPANFQKYGGVTFEQNNAEWVRAVKSTEGLVIMKDDQVVKIPYFSSDDGRTRAPREAGWTRFPFEELFESKPDPWCKGMPMRGHGVGMSGCGARGQALEGKTAEEILEYYFPGGEIKKLKTAE